MQSAIDIRVISSGERLDISDKESFEINMGGVSLLNLADRTATYSNSFKLPRTPNNEKILSFSSLSTVSVRPSVEVIITKGLFQRKATLKVLSFDNVYSCSVNYNTSTTSINTLKNLNAWEPFFGTLTLNTALDTDPLDEIILKCTDEYTSLKSGFFLPNSSGDDANSMSIPNISVPNYTGLGYRIVYYLSKITDLTGIEFAGDAITDTILNKCCLLNPYGVRIASLDSPDITIYEENDTDITSSKLKVSDVLKELCRVWALNIEEIDGVIYLNKISSYLTANPISTEGFTNVNKIILSELAKDNYIKYDIADTEKFGANYLSDKITSVGVGSKDIVKMNVVIPKAYDSTYADDPVYDFYNKNHRDKIVIGAFQAGAIDGSPRLYSEIVTPGTFVWNRVSVSYTMNSILMYDLDALYSSFLDPIFTNPIILDVNIWLNPLQADAMMTNRVINSVQLGGKYWVDSMAYNLQTGQAKLKLIRL